MSTRGCPYLGLEYDSSTFHAFPSEGNYCYKVRVPGPVDEAYQADVCLTKSHVNCAIFTGEDEQMQESAASPIQRKTTKRGILFVALLVVVLLILLVAVFLPGPQNISALFDSLSAPTSQPYYTRTATEVLLIEPAMTATSPRLSFPLIIRQPTVTPLPTFTFTPSPTVTQTPVPTRTPRIYIQPTAVRQMSPTKPPQPTEPPVLEPTPPASRPN